MASPTGTSSITATSNSGINYIDALLGPDRWTSSALTYSFPDNGATWSTATNAEGGYGTATGDGEPWNFFSPTSTSDRGFFAYALRSWSDVSGLSFTQVTESSKLVGEIRAAYAWLPELSGAAAWAYYPSTGPIGGDIWINAIDSDLAFTQWTMGSYGYFAVIHELGHALGLKHPFSGTTTLPTAYDSQSYTVMSYSAASGDPTFSFSYYPTTPMLYDIAAIQHLYGANHGYSIYDTTYLFSDVIPYHQTISDSGGNDTLEYSGKLMCTFDLDAGGGSRIGKPVYLRNQDGIDTTQIDNVWIAFGTTIENATGGNNHDIITGNATANRLTGGLGNDTLSGGTGNDTLVGGSGNDRLSGDTGSDQLSGGSGTDNFVLNHAVKKNIDIITDFNPSEGDVLAFDIDVFTALGNGIAAGNLVIAAKPKARDVDDYLLLATKGGKLYYDADGSGAGAAVQFAVIQLAGLNGSLGSLSATSFIIDAG